MGEKNALTALILDSNDNVAVVLKDISRGDIIVLKGKNADIQSADKIETGHKMAIAPICKGCDVIKYGQRIGVATTDIQPGEWVHLHNMESVYDNDFRKRVNL